MSHTPAPSDNPLLEYESVPAFDRIRAEHVAPAIRAVIARLDEGLAEFERKAEPTWEGTVRRLGDLTEPLGYAWNVVNHLMAVANTPELREAHRTVQNDVVAAYMRVGQSEAAYRCLRQLREGPGWAALDDAQRRVVELSIKQAELAGVSLRGEARERFNAIQAELADLSTRFSNNLLDATRAFALVLRSPDEVEGLPASLLATAHEAARKAGDAPADQPPDPARGPWRIGLDASSYVVFMEHARRRDLREALYRAYVTRASSGEYDNQPVIERILRLRREQAALLGYRTFAELSLSQKMASTVGAVEALLDEIRAAAMPAARRELDELRTFARDALGGDELRPWDVAFYAERLREKRFGLSDEILRPYFPLPQVLDGLFALAHRLFGVRVRPADGEVPVWHPDVRYFVVQNEAGQPIASFFLDPYARPGTKRGGAWMNNALDRKRRADGSLRLPVAYLVCDQSPPAGGRPSLMSFREVETLFHEFGHGLQHMLTAVEFPEAAGINNVEWDAVELPSQFMENWCYHRETLRGIARHVDTGEPLPDALFEKLCAAKTYRAGSLYLRQIYFGTLDLALHHAYAADGSESVLDVQRRIAAENTVLPILPEDRFLCSFSHLFAGGYAAGYYSYAWAEVLSADAFGAFEEAGLDNVTAIADTGRRFRDTVLALGGSRHPMEVFRAFRGREPSTAALLRHTGLAQTADATRG